jgi:hypothetical protein
MHYIFYTFITAILGLIRDYCKHKNIYITKFIRTPILCFIIHSSIKYVYHINNYYYNNNYIIYAIMYERWLMLILKSGISIYNNDYVNKRSKYIIKYKNTNNNKTNKNTNNSNRLIDTQLTNINDINDINDITNYHIV